MMDLTVIGHFIHYRIYVNGYKFIYIKDITKRDMFKNSFIATFAKIKDSEYAEELNMTNKILIDSEEINTSNFLFYTISDYFDLENDFKLGARSIFLNYLDLRTKNIEYSDDYQNYICSKQILIDNINELIDEFENLKINLSFTNNKKELLKEVNVNLIQDELEFNVKDLSYEEKVAFQIKLINKIAQMQDKPLLVIVDLKVITPRINIALENVENIDYIILVNDKFSLESEKVNHAFFDIDNSIDLYDENQVYERLMEQEKNIRYEHFINKLYNDELSKFLNK